MIKEHLLGRSRTTLGRWLLALVFVAVLLLVSRWGGDLLISSDPLPAHADGAVVMQGSVTGEIARVAGAVQLLRKGVAGRALLSVPAVSYWGESVPEAARGYLEKNYGSEIANRFVYCETGGDVNSTEQEALVLIGCIHQQGWQSAIIVTSNYHSRRAGYLWRKAVRETQPPIRLWIDGVPDPEFQPRGWWRKRLYAKTWFYEFTKLVTERLF